MKKAFLKSKRGRTRFFALISVASVLLLLALNLTLSYFGVQHSIFIDTTPEGLYTLSDVMKEECAFIDEELGEDGRRVKITFCSDPDTLIASDVTRMTYFMALQMQDHFENVEVETVNVTYNPTAVAEYKPTSLSTINPSDIIISYGDRYRVAGAASFWTTASGELYAFNGEYKLASIILSVTAKNRPAAYFVTNHGETYYDTENPESESSLASAYIYDLLTERGMEVKTLDLSDPTVTEIPSDCLLLIINNPKSDFTVDSDRLDEFSYVSETELLDRYLVSAHGSIMVAKDYKTELPNFEKFLKEWGFELSSSLVQDTGSYLESDAGDASTVIGIYDTDEESYGQAIYGSYANLASAPSMVFKDTGYISCSFGDTGMSIPEDGASSVSRNYSPFFYTTDKAKAYAANGEGEYLLLESADRALHTAAVTTRLELDTYTAEYKYSYMFCANSASFFSNELLGNASYANFDIVSALVDNMVRFDEYATIDLGGISANSSSYGGKAFLDTSILTTPTTAYDPTTGKDVVIYKGMTVTALAWLTVLVFVAPVCVAVFGIAVMIKRRFL